MPNRLSSFAKGAYVAWACVGLAVIVPARARPWNIKHQAAKDNLIAQAVAEAADGDTLMIEPGHYYEHIVLANKSITLLRGEGAGPVILDGAHASESLLGAIIYTPENYEKVLVIRGLEFVNGSGATDETGRKAGGAVCLWGQSGLARLEASDCVFRDNTAGTDEGNGGALYLSGLSWLRIERCTFEGNTAPELGGACYIQDRGGDLEIQDSVFKCPRTAMDGGAGVFVYGFGKWLLEGCSFSGEEEGGGTIVRSEAADIEVRNCVFRAELGTMGASILLSEPYHVGELETRMTLHGVAFWVRDSVREGLVDMGLSRGSMLIESATFVRSAVNVNCGQAADTRMERSIVVDADCFVSTAGTGVVRCNDVVGGELVITGSVVVEENLIADPLFCDEVNGDLTIAQDSPCAPGNGPDGCGGIGAFGVGCQQTPAMPMTWGRLKQLFR